MYAVPYDADYYISGDPARGYRDIINGNGNVGIRSGVSAASQLPAFNSVFHQKSLAATANCDNIRLDYNVSHRRHSVIQQAPLEHQGQRFVASNSGLVGPALQRRWEGTAAAAFKEEVAGNYAYCNNQMRSQAAPAGPSMAVLPTVPANSLRFPGSGEGSAFRQTRLPASAARHIDGSWVHLPPRNHSAVWDPVKGTYVAVQQRQGDLQNGFSSPCVKDGWRPTKIVVSTDNSCKREQALTGARDASNRSREEKEAAETLAKFSWTTNFPKEAQRQINGGVHAPVIRQAALQQVHQPPAQNAQQILRGATDASMAQRISHILQLQQYQKQQLQQQQQKLQQHLDAAANHVSSVQHVRDQMNHAAAARFADSGDSAASGTANLDRLLIKHLLDNSVRKSLVNDHAAVEQQRSGSEDVLKREQYGHNEVLISPTPRYNCQQRQAAPNGSSSLFQFVNEFIRQMDPNACNVIQHASVQPNLQFQRTAVEIPMHGDGVQQKGVVLPGVIQQHHSGSPPKPPTVSHPTHAVQNSIGPCASSENIQTSSTRCPTTIASSHHNFISPFGQIGKSDEEVLPKIPATPVVRQQIISGGPIPEITQAAYSRIDIRQSANVMPRTKFQGLKMGKSMRKNNGVTAAAMKIQKRLKKQAKKTTLKKRSIIATISELKLPADKDKNPLSLSAVGLLSSLVKNASLLGRFMRNQIRRKNIRSTAAVYYERLPTIFGPVAASLSLSNGATVKGLAADTATMTSSNSQQVPAPSGPLFTNGKKHVYAKIPVAKQEMATPLSDRIPLPDGSLESEESLKNRLENNVVQPSHKCGCVAEVNEDVEGPYYTHLAAAPSIEKMRTLLEERYNERGPAIRIEKVRFTNKEGKTPDGCPIAKWVIRRSGPEEKILCVVRQRPNHFCSTAVIAVIIVMWDGVPKQQADDLYSFLISTLPEVGVTTNRRCETNEKRSCACQGINERSGGASFSFGCSWSMYSNTCKFCKSRGDVRKFKLQPQAGAELEAVLEDKCHNLADAVAPVFKRMAPACYRNQTYCSDKAQSCRLGYVPRGPFSGITACVDFCAHAHKDVHNMNNGCTVVVTLTKHRGFEKPDDEQLHVLPLCVLEPTDEYGSQENQWKKAQIGSLEILDAYPMHLRLRTKSLPSCKERTKQQRQQRLNGPTKSKHFRLDQEATDASNILHPASNSNGDAWMNASSANCLIQNQSYNCTSRLPSVDTFSHFYNSRVSALPNGEFERRLSAVGANYEMGTSQSPSRYVSHDLVGITQGLHTPTAAGREEDIYVAYTDNREAFNDPRVGGVAVALTHGSVLLEVAKRELHATTALKTPDRRDPKRISLVFYQHKHLNYTHHGQEEHEKKTAEKNALGAAQDASSEDETENGKNLSKPGDSEEVRWPLLQPLRNSGEWKTVGAGNLCTTVMTDSVTTASSGACDCRPTQKYVGHVLTSALAGSIAK